MPGKEDPMRARTLLRIALLLATVLLPLACAHELRILEAPPPSAYRTLGMVSGHGENESSAMHMTVEQARQIDADAIVIEGRRNAGPTIIITARAIKYTEAPPQ
jgi:hypothetical protein